ncbi:predicted protein [Verticillium alfalfae VaMs.102]|uniref:Predicted protein n=1 Tax=Verticillium alfalfae (strain VaMs.102 / ATCC MYA-4576 / FGSC 10136) TaxID=526221 RepID=C9SN03_VERA1|nr:predicted protein [Verticillium alfalfae VaMs.102]EEY20168.1 predicted protein [Verticillium alfalfae VaMs.102]
MDANPAPGAVPAVASIDQVVADEPAAAAPATSSLGAPATGANPLAAEDAKTADEPAAPAAPAAAAAPKAATVEPKRVVTRLDASDKARPSPCRKRKPGRPPKAVTANGTENGNGHGEDKEGLGEKLAKKVKKVLPTPGKTARKTRSQGPA